MKIKNAWNWFIYSRSNNAMIARTGAEAVLSWTMTSLPEILGICNIPIGCQTVLSSFLMMIFSWLLGVIRGNNNNCNK